MIKYKQRINPKSNKQLYGSKRINLLRIAQEKKIKALLLVMRCWGDKFKNPTEYDRLLWRESFTSILKMEAYLRSGLNHTLSTKEMKLANMLYRKYC
jgi:hypothetical protein|tara:strand:- start:185 stop:475 length:291 start_codon:yes stop_codon:yes gene_type:complete